MKSLETEVIATLNSATYPVTVKSVRPSYSKLAPVYPMIIVREINNKTRVALNGEEILADLEYQIDVYSKDMSVSGAMMAGAKVCGNIGAVIDTELNETYGLTRVVNTKLPDVNDATVSRLTLRYTGILNVKTDYMYR